MSRLCGMDIAYDGKVFDLFSIVGKELQALEIIKTKKVNIKCIISGWLLGKYNSYKAHISLTQEEYDLLKEILLWETKENYTH